MSTPQLNQDQQDAVRAISAFIIGPQKEFFLTGGPGVGKTFTTRELATVLPQILKNYKAAMNKKDDPMALALTSTTNKAAAVLAEQTGHPTQTIHSFLGVIPKQNFDTGKTHLKRTNKWKIHSNVMIFVDESSMIDRALYELIQEATDESCKVIYIGDKNQLPPVMEKLSPAVMLAEDPNLHYEITTPVRNAGSPALMDLCNRLREDILIEQSKDKLTNWPATPGEIIYIDGPEFEKLVDTTFGKNGTIKETDEELACRILCYTNKSVIGYNNHIRQLRGLPEHPVVGERLVCNSHFQLSRDQSFNVEEEIYIHAVSGPEDVQIDEHNSLSAYKITVSAAHVTRRDVYVPADRSQYNVLLKHFKKHKLWKKYYKLQETFIDLRNREAATVYKAQGSTYDSVIMVMNDIFASRDINQLRRMLYVGASRARKRIYIYDQGIYQNTRGIYR